MLLLWSYGTVSAQNYKVDLELDVQPGSGNWGDGCRNFIVVDVFYNINGREESVEAFDHDFNTGMNVPNKRLNLSGTNLIFTRMEVRTSRNWKRLVGGCGGDGSFNGRSRTTTMNTRCSGTYTDIAEWWRANLKIKIKPVIDISFPGGTRTLCSAKPTRIQATSGFAPASAIYNWQYDDGTKIRREPTPAFQRLLNLQELALRDFLSCMSRIPGGCIGLEQIYNSTRESVREFTGKRYNEFPIWTPITGVGHNSTITITMANIYPDPVERGEQINTPIWIRVDPNCGFEGDESKKESITFLPDPPRIVRPPAVENLACSYSTSGSLRLFFERQIYDFEKLDFLIQEKNQLNVFVPYSANPGVLNLTPNGDGTWRYDWNINPRAPMKVGEYRVVVTGYNRNTNSEFCEAFTSAPFFISAPDPVDFTATHTADQDERCFDANDGGVTLTASGGTGTYRYTIGTKTGTFTAAQSPFEVTGLSSGAQQVFVRDTNGCSEKENASDPDKRVSFTIVPATQITHTLDVSSIVMPGAPGASDGTIAVTSISGGTPLRNTANQAYYTYEIQNSATEVIATGEALAGGDVLRGITAGMHTVVYKDANDCPRSFALPEFTDPAPITYEIRKTDPSCITSEDGTLRVFNIQGGYPNYTLAWTRNGTAYGSTPTITGGAATYSLTITDARSGIAIIPNIVFDNVPTQVVIDTIDISPAECLGDYTVVTIAASGGRTGIYEYTQWVGATSVWQDDNTFQFLSDTDIEYRFRVREKGAGCLSEISDPVTTYRNLKAAVVLANPVCFNDCNGSIALTPLGGTPPYTYRWEHNGSTDKDQTGLCEGEYTVIVTDGLACSLPLQYTLTNPAQLIVNLGEDITLCKDQTATLDATWPNPLMQYQWTSDAGFTSDQPSIKVNTPDVYTVTITDEKGCTATDSIWVDTTTDVIDAFFAVSDQVFAEDSFVIVNLSDPYPDAVEWLLPPEATLEYGDDDYAEIRITTPGVYQITAKVYRGLCIKTDTLEVNVVNRAFDAFGGATETGLIVNKPISTHDIYPNPARNGTFTVETRLPEKQDVHIRVFNVKDNQLIAERADLGKDHYTHTFTINMPAGLYFVVVETSVGDYMVSKLVIE